MEFLADSIYHVYNKGNNSEKIFFTDENYLYFLKKIRKELLPFCSILSYCLMPNHFHLILTANNNLKHNELNNAFGTLLRSYTRAINIQENRKGSLFQQKTKSKELIDSSNNNTISYLAVCTHYLHQNPIRAKLVDNLNHWQFSSYLDYAGFRDGSLCNQKLFFELTGIKKDEFVSESEEMWEMKKDILKI